MLLVWGNYEDSCLKHSCVDFYLQLMWVNTTIWQGTMARLYDKRRFKFLSLFLKLDFILFHAWTLRQHVCAPHERSEVPGSQIHCDWTEGWLLTTMWVLVIGPRSLERAIGVLKPGPIFFRKGTNPTCIQRWWTTLQSHRQWILTSIGCCWGASHPVGITVGPQYSAICSPLISCLLYTRLPSVCLSWGDISSDIFNHSKIWIVSCCCSSGVWSL